MVALPRKWIEDSVLEEALARAASGVFVVGSDGAVVMWNPTAERIMGYSARAAIGRLSCELFAGEADGRPLCYRGCHGTAPVRVDKILHNFEVHVRTKAGKPIWLTVSALGIPSRGGRGRLTIHLMRNVTAEKKLLGLVEERLLAPASLPEARALTRREREILQSLSSGLSTKVVAERLHVSRATVRNHVQSILEKLGAHSRLEAVAYATSNRLI